MKRHHIVIAVTLALWCFTGLPILILAVGFSGGDILGMLVPSVQSLGGFFAWLIGWAIIAYPVPVIFLSAKAARSSNRS